MLFKLDLSIPKTNRYLNLIIKSNHKDVSINNFLSMESNLSIYNIIC